MLQTLFECMVYLAIFPGIPFVGYLITNLLKKKDEKDQEESERYKKYKRMFEYSQKYNP